MRESMLKNTPNIIWKYHPTYVFVVDNSSGLILITDWHDVFGISVPQNMTEQFMKRSDLFGLMVSEGSVCICLALHAWRELLHAGIVWQRVFSPHAVEKTEKDYSKKEQSKI